MTTTNKVWTVKGGEIGTAHYSRDGQLVDFRPGRAMVKNNVGSLVHGVPSRPVEWCVLFTPSKGVEISPIAISAKPIEWEIDPHGYSKFLVVSRVQATLQSETFDFDVPAGIFYRADPTKSTPESIAHYEQKESARAIREAKREESKKKAAAEKIALLESFPDQLQKTYSGLTGWQKNMVKRFIRNGKAENEALLILEEIPGFKLFQEGHRKDLAQELNKILGLFPL
jgi:hypothetical protein